MDTIILAGGKSSRMGTNKALLDIHGVRVIDHLVAEFTPISEKIMVIANEHEPYMNLGTILKKDHPRYQGMGPLAGIYTGIKESTSETCLVIACDMPFASQNLALQLLKIQKEEQADAVIPIEHKQLHPLFGIYHTGILPFIKEKLDAGKRSAKALLDDLNVTYYKLDQGIEAVWNMNTLDDYQKAKKIAARRDQIEL